jgi:hypothetical protein
MLIFHCTSTLVYAPAHTLAVSSSWSLALSTSLNLSEAERRLATPSAMETMKLSCSTTCAAVYHGGTANGDVIGWCVAWGGGGWRLAASGVRLRRGRGFGDKRDV